MPPIEYDNDQNHKEFTDLVDRLKRQGFSRQAIGERIGKVDKSTITRYYNPEEKNSHNPQLFAQYIGMIRQAFAKELGLVTSEEEGGYESLKELLQEAIQEWKASRLQMHKSYKVSRMLLIRQRRGRKR